MQTFGRFLRTLRQRRRLSAVMVARHFRGSRNTVHQWETDAREPSRLTIHRLLDLYEATPEERLLAWALPRATSQEEAEDRRRVLVSRERHVVPLPLPVNSPGASQRPVTA